MKHGEIAVNIRAGLLGHRVWFKPADGSPQRAVAASKIWPGQPGMPLINLESGETSVPHATAVAGASGFFWTLTIDGDEAIIA